MISNYKQAQLDRWTEEVRYRTKRDMIALRQERERLEQQLQPREEDILVTAWQWWQNLLEPLRGGLPAIERAVLRFVTPRLRPEQLLPEAPRRRPSRKATPGVTRTAAFAAWRGDAR